MQSLNWFTEESQIIALEIYSSFFPEEGERMLQDFIKDVPHVTLEKPVTLDGATIKGYIYHKVQKLLLNKKLSKKEKEQLDYIKKLDIVLNESILYDLSIEELTAIGYFDEDKSVYDIL